MINDFNFFIGRMYFTSNYGSQSTFIYQPTLGTKKVLIMFLVGNQMKYLILKLTHYILLSYIA